MFWRQFDDPPDRPVAGAAKARAASAADAAEATGQPGTENSGKRADAGSATPVGGAATPSRSRTLPGVGDVDGRPLAARRRIEFRREVEEAPAPPKDRFGSWIKGLVEVGVTCAMLAIGCEAAMPVHRTAGASTAMVGRDGRGKPLLLELKHCRVRQVSPVAGADAPIGADAGVTPELLRSGEKTEVSVDADRSDTGSGVARNGS